MFHSTAFFMRDRGKTIRRTIARALHWAELRSGHALQRAKATRKPRILMYHAIGDGDTPAALFEWQMRLLHAEFDLVSLPALLDRLSDGKCTGGEVAITFDDGVRNHAAVAYPLLRRLGVPATFFVCPGLIDSGRWIWNMELRLRLRLLHDSERARLARAVGAADPDVEALILWSKRQRLGEREQFETRVRAHTGEFEPSAAQFDRYSPMTWEQALDIDPALITIGSHTVSHPILTTLTEEQRHAEIAGSRSMLEARLGRTAELFCYPGGGHDDRTVEMVRESYRAAVTTRAGFVDPDQNMYRLPRIPAGQRASLFMRRLHNPGA